MSFTDIKPFTALIQGISIDIAFRHALMCCAVLMTLPVSAANVVVPVPPVVFLAAETARFPSGWKTREDAARQVYAVSAEGDHAFLRAESHKNGHQIGFGLSADPERLPWFRFSWRLVTLPLGGDERRKETNDSALGVYVIFAGMDIPPKTIKYVWSTTLPVGTTTESPLTSRVKIVVLRSGPGQAGRWEAEEVNVFDDFRRLFKTTAVPKVKGIGVLTDSDNTGSAAAGDYLFFAFGAERIGAAGTL